MMKLSRKPKPMKGMEFASDTATHKQNQYFFTNQLSKLASDKQYSQWNSSLVVGLGTVAAEINQINVFIKLSSY